MLIAVKYKSIYIIKNLKNSFLNYISKKIKKNQLMKTTKLLKLNFFIPIILSIILFLLNNQVCFSSSNFDSDITMLRQDRQSVASGERPKERSRLARFFSFDWITGEPERSRAAEVSSARAPREAASNTQRKEPYRDQSAFTRSQPVETSSSFFRFEWLFGSPEGSRAASASQRTSPVEVSDHYSPSQTRSRDVTEIDDRRRANGATSRSDGDFIYGRGQRSSLRAEMMESSIWLLGISFGTSHSLTDIEQNKYFDITNQLDYQINNFNYAAGAFTRYQSLNWFGFKGGINYAKVSGSSFKDNIESELIDDLELDFDNILDFENDLFEFYLNLEYHSILLQDRASDLYVFAGIAVFFNDISLTKDGGQPFYHDDLAEDYGLVQPAFPLGFGYSYTTDNGVNIGYEAGWRYTLFHHLDGVDFRDERPDTYFFNTISISISLN